VLVEKPVAMRPDDARALAALASERGLHCGVALQNRLNRAMRLLKQAATEQAGRLVTASARLRWARFQDYYEDGWHGTWAMDGGVINQQALHHLDALDWVCGPIEAVCAAATRRLNELEAEDTLVAAVRFADGGLGTIEATTAARPDDLEASLSIVTDRGHAHVGGIALNEVVGWGFDGDEAAIRAEHSEQVANGYGNSHGPLIQQMVDAVLGRVERPAVVVEDAYGVTDLVHALYASEETGGWVSLADRPVSTRLGLSSQSGDVPCVPLRAAELQRAVLEPAGVRAPCRAGAPSAGVPRARRS
jgi:UDP-N-acetyl-2-amino-2-deoxyglucuronate dehydrogenase